METSASQTSTTFGLKVTRILNIFREELVYRLRVRSGYGQECNPPGSLSNNGDSGVSNFLQGYTPIALQGKLSPLIFMIDFSRRFQEVRILLVSSKTHPALGSPPKRTKIQMQVLVVAYNKLGKIPTRKLG